MTEVLKVSPSQIIFGSSIDHDVHLITHPEHNSTEFQYSSKIQHMLEIQQKFLDIARHNQLQDDRLWTPWNKSLGDEEIQIIYLPRLPRERQSSIIIPIVI